MAKLSGEGSVSDNYPDGPPSPPPVRRTVRTVSTADLIKRLNSRFLSNPNWEALFRSVSRVIDERVTQPREQITSLRDSRLYRRGDWMNDDTGQRVIVNHISLDEDGSGKIYAQAADSNTPVEFSISSNTKDREILIDNCQHHGFNYFSSKLSDADYARIMDWIEWYWPEGGNKNFAGFMGFIKNMRISIEQLWSKETIDDFSYEALAPGGPVDHPNPAVFNVDDHYPFLEPLGDPRTPPLGSTYSNASGKLYLTSHIELRYDAVITPNPDLMDLFYLFYYLAPIHLVLERIVATIEPPDIPVEVFTNPKMSTLTMIDSANFDFELSAEAKRSMVMTHGEIGLHEGTLLIIEDPS